MDSVRLIDVIKSERKRGVTDGVYARTQVVLAFCFNKSDSFTLTYEQVESIYKNSEIEHPKGTAVNANDVMSVTNNFLLFDYMLDTADQPLDGKLIAAYEEIMSTRFRPVKPVDNIDDIVKNSTNPIDLYLRYIMSGGDERVGHMIIHREYLKQEEFSDIE